MEELAVRSRDSSRSRSRSSIISLRVRFRLEEPDKLAARECVAPPAVCGLARGVCSVLALFGGTFRTVGGGRATSFPFSFSIPVLRKAAGLTFSLSSTITSSSSRLGSVVGGVKGEGVLAGGERDAEAGELAVLHDPGTERNPEEDAAVVFEEVGGARTGGAGALA